MTTPVHATRTQIRRSNEEGRALVTALRQSGLTRAVYARQHHVSVHLLVYWAKKFPAQSPIVDKSIAQIDHSFIQVPITTPGKSAPPPHAHIEIRLASGAVMCIAPGIDPALLTVVLHAVGHVAC